MSDPIFVGTIPPEPEPPSAPVGMMPTDGTDTSTIGSQANIAASSEANAVHMNANHQILYDTAVENYNLNMGSGQKHNPPLVPPVAPAKWVLLPPGVDGYRWYGPSDTEVLTPTPPLKLATTDLGSLPSLTPSNAPRNMFMGIGHSAGGQWYDANFGDTIPGGQPAPPQPDGHEYIKVGSPVGWGWWLQTK